jgi:hypothetical protein
MIYHQCHYGGVTATKEITMSKRITITNKTDLTDEDVLEKVLASLKDSSNRSYDRWWPATGLCIEVRTTRSGNLNITVAIREDKKLSLTTGRDRNKEQANAY